MHPTTAAGGRQALPGLVLVAVALLVLVTACTTSSSRSQPGQDPAVRETMPPRIGASATTSPAAELRAGLTTLLVERTYLVASAVEAVERGDAAVTAAAGQSLTDASTALVDVLAGTYPTARGPLREALQRTDQLIAEHAEALVAGDTAATDRVGAELTASHRELAEVLRQVVPTVRAEEVAQPLSGDLDAQRAALGGDFLRLRAVAAQAAETARLLAAGIAMDRGLGDVSTPAVQLRADLTGLLTEHVALVASLARDPNLDPEPEPVGARAALRANAGDLADLLGRNYPAARATFLRSWSAQLDQLERYAIARTGGGIGTAEAGLARGYPAELGRLLAEHVGGLPASTAAAELGPALNQLLTAIETAGSPQGPAALRDATAGTAQVAALLASAVAEDQQLA